MCRNRGIFENIVLIFDRNYYALFRRDSLIINCQLLIVNYKHQFVALQMKYIKGGTSMEYIARYDSPLGPLTLSADEEGLTGITFSAPATVTADNTVLTKTRRWLDSYFRGEAPDPASVPLSPKGTPFQLLIWNRLLSIPYGESVT